MKTEIWITFDMPGQHSWPQAPEHLKFLSYPHRHVFKFRAGAKVTHNDRDLEFFELQSIVANKVMDIYEMDGLFVQFGSYSCEMIAVDVLSSLPEYITYLEVSEDGENGARVWR